MAEAKIPYEGSFQQAEVEAKKKMLDSLSYEQEHLEKRLKEIQREKSLVKKGKPTFSHRQ